MATTQILFLGYSLEDINFRVIYRQFARIGRGALAVLLPPNDIIPGVEEEGKQYVEEYMKKLFNVDLFFGTFEDFFKEASEKATKRLRKARPDT